MLQIYKTILNFVKRFILIKIPEQHNQIPVDRKLKIKMIYINKIYAHFIEILINTIYVPLIIDRIFLIINSPQKLEACM